MPIKVFSISILLASFMISYILQKRCVPGSIKFKGKILRMPEILEEFEIHKVFIKNGKYFAQGKEKETGEHHFIQIDEDVMANVPAGGTGSGPLLRVMVYKGSAGLTLAEPEIRYKLGIEYEDSSEVTQLDLAYAEYIIWFLYELRNIFWTIATIGVWRSPHISIFFSLIAITIQIRNVIPPRFEKLKKYDIMNAKETHKEGQFSNNSEEEYPPGYDMWSDNQKFLYHAGQRIANSRTADSEIDFLKSNTLEVSSGGINNVEERRSIKDLEFGSTAEADLPLTDIKSEIETVNLLRDFDELNEWVNSTEDSGCFEPSKVQASAEKCNSMQRCENQRVLDERNSMPDKKLNFFDNNRPKKTVECSVENADTQPNNDQAVPANDKKSASTAIKCCKSYENVYGSPPKRISTTAMDSKKRGRGAGSKNGHNKDNAVTKLLK